MISGKQTSRRPRTATRLGLAAAALVLVVGAVGVAAVIAGHLTSVASLRLTPVPAVPAAAPDPSADLGIFASVAGWLVYGDRDGIWGVDPAGPTDPASRTQLAAEAGTPLGWSSDGTRLLIMRAVGFGRWHLVVLDADGSQTKVAGPQGWIPGATISPDGSRVVFATYGALYSVDVDGGRSVVLLKGGEGMVYAPTFSPDGAKIAYVLGSGDHSHRVWVMDADGSDTHQILANQTTLSAGHVHALAWSPAGDRIALGLEVDTYTFAPDGSGFAQVLTGGTRPYWSPDGSKLAYSKVCPPREDCSLAIADADGSQPREFAINKRSRGSGPWHPGQLPAGPSTPGATNPTPTPSATVSDELVLRLQSWRQGFVELAVYADGRVIWVPSNQDGYLHMRLTPRAPSGSGQRPSQPASSSGTERLDSISTSATSRSTAQTDQ